MDNNSANSNTKITRFFLLNLLLAGFLAFTITGFNVLMAKTACLSGTAVGLPAGQSLRVRSGPGTNYQVLGSLNIGARFKVTDFEMNGGSLTPDPEDPVDRSKPNNVWFKIAYINNGSVSEGWVNYLYVTCSGEKYDVGSSDRMKIEPITSGSSGSTGGGSIRDPISTTPCSDNLSQRIEYPVPSGNNGQEYGVYSTYMFCKFHTGVDITANRSANILAAADGIVVHIGNMWYESARTESEKVGIGKGRGPMAIIIEHAPGVYTTYSHNSSVAAGVRVGTCVKRGQVIAGVGNLGYSGGPHLHFEVIKGVNYTGDWTHPFPAPTMTESDPICHAYQNPASFF